MCTAQKCFSKIVHIHKKEKKWKPETSPTSCLLTTQVGIATSEAGLSVLCEKHRINKVRLSLSTQTVTGYILCKTWRCTVSFPVGTHVMFEWKIQCDQSVPCRCFSTDVISDKQQVLVKRQILLLAQDWSGKKYLVLFAELLSNWHLRFINIKCAHTTHRFFVEQSLHRSTESCFGKLVGKCVNSGSVTL